ncbi:MAG: cytochrome c family protein [Pseudomonadota bacterium]|nr:cytochrome c family protein [Pseudomonadota bacterium]
MWSANTSYILGGGIVALWVVFAADFIGDQLIPLPELPKEVDAAATKAADKLETAEEVKEDALAQVVQSLPQLLADASADKGAKVAKKCTSCHTFEKGGKNRVGPNLYGMIGRDRGTVDGYKYSKAILAMAGKWGFSDINAFLTKPKDFIAGTKMVFPGLKSAADRADLILYMRGQADQPVALPN